MEVAGEDGSKLVLGRESATVFGRGSGFTSNDRTVSRRHLILETKTLAEPRVSFEVIGRNPIWLRSGTDEEIRAFRRSEKGEMAPGDSFCVGGKQSIWFELKQVAEIEAEQNVSEGENEFAEISGRSFDAEDIDISGIDPVKEFGFLVKGHEFDCYGNRVIRDAKKWKWFLEEPRKNSDDDEDYGRRERRGARKKRKNGARSDDEDWTDENEDAEEMVVKVKKVQRPKYSTRSKDHNKPHKNTGGSKTADSNRDLEEEDEDDKDEDDETLGGFIVDDVVDNEERVDEEDEEEEDILEDEDDEED